MQKSIKLGGLDSVRLPFETQRHRARAEGFDLRGKVAFVGWGDEDMESAREGLPPLHVDCTGVNVYPLVRCVWDGVEWNGMGWDWMGCPGMGCYGVVR